MSQVSEKKQQEIISTVDKKPLNNITALCQKCGGNGYTKSNPNCYHTCLVCLGRGSKIRS